MARAPRNRTPKSGGGNGDYDGGRHEPYDDPDEHIEIEKQRFLGSLPPTPELYEKARRQWYRLPGSLVRPSMGPIGDTGDDQSDSKRRE
jgi:hypothetical protein